MTSSEPALADIEEEWSELAPLLEALIRRSPRFGLSLSEVRCDCLNEEADLWKAPEGYLVTKFIRDPVSQEKTLFMWIACAKNPGVDMGTKYLSFFDEVAKYTGCRYIELWSSRAGMGRYLAPHGFSLFYRSFRRTIDG